MLWHSLKKEIRLISMDIHSIAVLLLLPVAFMLIMTFAMSSKPQDVLAAIQLSSKSSDPAGHNQKLLLGYLQHQGINLSAEPQSNASLEFTDGFEQQLLTSQKPLLTLTLTSGVSPQLQAVLTQQVEMAFAKVKLHLFLLDSEMMDPELPIEEQMQQVEAQTSSETQLQIEGGGLTSNVTEYSIPSWIIFGVYFIVLPISITLLNEEKNGTLIRLKTFPISMSRFFIFKLLAFFCISLLQFVLLCAIGLLLVPPLVGMPAYPVTTLITLIPALLCTSLAAVSFAGLIATQIRSYEQAIVIGGGINIILAALSGFMVPLDIMPAAMQQLAHGLPMRWSADLLKAAMLPQETTGSILLLGYLVLFSVVSLTLALTLFRRKTRNLLWS